MRNFRKYKVWQDSMSLTKDIYKITKHLPDSEKFGLTNQMRRCSVSIPSNIAEGASRKSEKEFFRFLEIALGSAFELETQVQICVELDFLKIKEIENISISLNSIQRQLSGMKNLGKG